MHKSPKIHVTFFYLLVDSLCAAVSFVCAYSAKYGTLAVWQDVHAKEYAAVLLLWFVSFVAMNSRKGLYVTNRMSSLAGEARSVLMSVLVSALGVAVAVFVFKFDFFSRQIFVYAAALLFVLCALWRFFKRLIVRHLVAHGYNNFNVLIVGLGDDALDVIDEMKGNPYLGLRLKGFIGHATAATFAGYPIFGTMDDLDAVVRREFIDEIYVVDDADKAAVRRVLDVAGRLNKTVRILAGGYGASTQSVDVAKLGVLPMLTFSPQRQMSAGSARKRFFDVTVTLVGLVVLLPFLLLLAVLIKLDSKGPVLYVSKRSGYKGRIFDFYKFRTMVVDADQKKQQLLDQNEVRGGTIFKIKKDPRMTRIGGFLRRYSLDELPQLLNVLKGDMSLVGPRPFPVHEFKAMDPYHMARAEAKPGLTGMAQIKGRSDLAFHQWMRWDLWYVNNWTVWLDVLILLWTVPAVIKGKGAY